ncbi:DUF3307 domain-containing protein [Robiginitalea biformata]|nr:DUF3307 domain-containing protein [Robiginitalea biformata]
MLIVKLLLAHMLGDFLLQPGRALRHKQARKAGSWFFYLHGLVHFSLTLLLVWDLRFWQEALVIAASHLVIDAVKLYTAHWYRRDSIPFFLDQLAHVLVLLVVATYPDTTGELAQLAAGLNWPVLTGLFFVTFPAAFLTAKLLEGLGQQIPMDHKSLPRAGMYIGILERLFVFAFILLGRWEAIGLLIAAKSVFRFNDLKEFNNRRWTEYILIGTLLSFGMAILAGLWVLPSLQG